MVTIDCVVFVNCDRLFALTIFMKYLFIDLIALIWRLRSQRRREWQVFTYFLVTEAIERMISIEKWRFSWTLVATVASVLTLVSVVHLFLFPLVPSFDYFTARQQIQNSCVPIKESAEGVTNRVWENSPPQLNLDHRFPADLHNAVVYRNAPWKAEIGRWLSGCDSVAKEVDLVEVLNQNGSIVFIHFLRVDFFRLHSI